MIVLELAKSISRTEDTAPRDSQDNKCEEKREAQCSVKEENEVSGGTQVNEDPVQDKGDDESWLVRLGEDDDPKRMSTSRKWIIVLVICSGAFCATCASSVVSLMLLPYTMAELITTYVCRRDSQKAALVGIYT